MNFFFVFFTYVTYRYSSIFNGVLDIPVIGELGFPVIRFCSRPAKNAL